MMRGIYAIGNNSYPNDRERLFVHQMGDGFAIVSDFGESSLDRPIAIASALMRHVTTTGTFAAAAIAEGDFADILGIYPEEIFSGNNAAMRIDMGRGVTPGWIEGLIPIPRRTKRVEMGGGSMTLFTVMGTAFIRAYGIGEEAPSGPFLTIAEAQRDRITDSVKSQATSGRKGQSLCSIDWLQYESEHLRHIRRTAGIHVPSFPELQLAIKDYCKHYPSIGDKWSDDLRELLEIEI